MSKIWSGLRTGLKFTCTACGKCCNNKRSNVSLNLSEVDSMSLFMGVDKLSFLDKYTEEKEINGQTYTKLKHKADLSCVLLDIDGKECTVHGARPVQCRSYPFLAANVIGEAEWRSEANRCEGISIDTATDSFSSPPQSAAVSKSDRVSDSDEDAPPPNILYDGVISDFESTHHGMLSCHIEPVASHEDNTVHPDTILRQMILHEIHSDGMGPDWEYQDSLELLLESEQNSLESGTGDVLEDFKTEFCSTHYSHTLHEDSVLRVVDTTTPTPPHTELLMSVDTTVHPVTSEGPYDYNYDLMDLSAALGVEPGPESLESEDSETLNSSTKRRFEFLNSSSLVQSEIYLKSPRTPGSLGVDSDTGSEVPAAMDHTRLVMPIHRILSVLCRRVIASAISRGSFNSIDAKAKGNSEQSDILVSIIGAGGFALPSHLLALNHSLPEGRALTVHAVEPEERVLRAARDFFGAEYSMSCEGEGKGEGAGRGSTCRPSSTQVIAYGTDGLTYLRDLSSSKDLKSSSSSSSSGGVDFLVIDAFEETPPPGFGPADSFSNRAPPSSLVSPSLFVDCLRPCSSGSKSRDSRETENESGQEGLKSLGSILSSGGGDGGGVLAMNLFGPSEWIQEVYAAVQSCPGLSRPVLLRIKGEKNILLVASRTSGV